ncbi:glycoside hydrolase family 108 protein [Pelagibacterium sp. 26DY04]|uniref:glycoside hydrolase family 108 protein n=1 Tax=Pelagibacterium sp. 26DY04 TaxID=2967130 RepID=UPI0028164874|nr:glycoside hydrolase family 108 protein [Pelagibacterium sp. 26DY04]WMT85553.1 glycoside hydrolase family 108 protein [Pelagibacterium sp. 26DY04]
MARANFAAALSAVLLHEGGWANNPKDPGGATMKGVTLATYRRYRPGATKEQLRNITDAELQRIYRDGYWDVIRGDDLPAGVDYAVFDFAVNSGPSRAAKFLQRMVGVPQDGKIGPVTLSAVRAANPEAIIRNLCNQRQAWLQTLSTFATFGKGWTRRVSEVKAKALAMAAEPIRQPDDPGVDTPTERPKVNWPAIIELLPENGTLT